MMHTIKSSGGLTRGRGMTESVRILWFYSMHKCAGIHETMSQLTQLYSSTSEQHVEFGLSRMKRDNVDLFKIKHWFDVHHPFDEGNHSLRCLSSGLSCSEDDIINCDQAEEVGAKVHKKMDSQVYSDISLKRSDQVKTLLNLKKGVKIEGNTVHVDPMILFSFRLSGQRT